MGTVNIQYKGKRFPLELKLPWLEQPVTFPTNKPISMDANEARRLVRDNPNGFEILYPKGTAVDNIIEEAPWVEPNEEVFEDEEPEEYGEKEIEKAEEDGAEAEGTVYKEEDEESGKSVHHMNKTELVAYAKRAYGVELDIDADKRSALLKSVLSLQKGGGDDSA